MPITGLAIAAGLGLAKSELVDRPREEKERKLAAATQRLSPWTGLTANKIPFADPLGTAAQFGVTGALIGGGMKKAPTAGAEVDPVATSPWSAGDEGMSGTDPYTNPRLMRNRTFTA